MKAIMIDPNTKSVTIIDISKDARLSDYFGEKPQVAVKLPKGDVLFAEFKSMRRRSSSEDLGPSRDPA
jgi:hypothetical protein